MRTEEAQARASGTRTSAEGRQPLEGCAGAEVSTAAAGQTNAEGSQYLMEAAVERGNVWRAYRKVVENKGAPGIDEVTVVEFKGWLKDHWPTIRAALLAGSYMPQAVRGVEIPKPSGGIRRLSIPTVCDRLIQQALLQVLEPIFEPGFSESSYGFRKGRNAWQAVRAAQEYMRQGKSFVVDIDLESFFDRVNHDMLMSRIARKVEDKRVLKLIRRYLEAGVMQDGLVKPRIEGTPQGGPLSPLLSNILLTDLDRELERRGLSFCRYADDCNVYVSGQAAAEHVMAAITDFLERRLKLRVNREKSACARPWKRKFLGYSFLMRKGARVKIAPESLKRLHKKVREHFRKGRGRNLGTVIVDLNALLRGWMSYFRLTEVKGVLEDLEMWIRRKLRCLLWRQWKRCATRAKKLMKQGLDKKRAWASATNGRGPWWNAGASHMHQAYPKAYFDRAGLVSLMDIHRRFQCSS